MSSATPQRPTTAGFTSLLCTTPDDIARCMAIRFAVFVTEQGYDADVEVDDKDAGSDHLLGQLDGRDVAVVRLFPPLAKLGRLAVVSSSRGTGAGKLMVEALEEHVKSGKGKMGEWRRVLARTGSLPAEERGRVKIQANVQKHAERFYSKCGYVAEGEDFLEEGQPHVKMTKVVKVGYEL